MLEYLLQSTNNSLENTGSDTKMDQSKQVVFEVQLTQKEYTSFSIQLQKKSLVIGFFFYFAIFIITVLGVNQFELYPSLVAVALVGGLLLSILITISLYVFMIIQSKRHFKSNALIQYKQTYEITDSGISIVSASGNVHIHWNEIFRVLETKSLIALYVGRNSAIILPKENLTIQIGNLKTLLMNNIPNNKVKFESYPGGKG